MQDYFIFLEQNPLVPYIIITLYSLCVGSFINVVIYRLPIMLKAKWTGMCAEYLDIEREKLPTTSLIFPRSACPHCNTKITFWQNIPLISYCLLKGKCFNCRAFISSRYPLIELLTALLSLIVFHHFGLSYQTIWGFILIYCLIPLAFIDIDTQLLPDDITLPLIWLGLLANLKGMFVPLEAAVLGAFLGYTSLWLFVKLFYLLTGKEGMGEGDFKLFSALGAWLGWQLLPLIILFSSLCGAIIGIIILNVTHKNKDTPLPFGPYLCLGGFIALIWGHSIIDWYLSSFLN